jgi:hypothetical protein
MGLEELESRINKAEILFLLKNNRGLLRQLKGRVFCFSSRRRFVGGTKCTGKCMSAEKKSPTKK